MKVSTSLPFKIIYSLFQHEFLGYLFESFVIQLDSQGKLTLANQNISSRNANDFLSGLDSVDFELIQLMDSIQHNAILKKFSNKKIRPEDFLSKVFDDENGQKNNRQEIENYLDIQRALILPLLKEKELYIMGQDGEPAGKKINILPKKASLIFYIKRSPYNTIYHPSIKYDHEKLSLRSRNSHLLCKNPAWVMVDENLYSFNEEVDGKKLIPFLKKEYIMVPQKVEKTFYEKFVTSLIKSFKVVSKGFEIITQSPPPVPVLTLSNPETELSSGNGNSQLNRNGNPDNQLQIELSFQYGRFEFPLDQKSKFGVELENEGNHFTFYRIMKDLYQEKKFVQSLVDLGLPVKENKATMPRSELLEWISQKQPELGETGFILKQRLGNQNNFFLGQKEISLEVNESGDWFDIKAKVKFGEYQFPIALIRKMVLAGKREITLPNQEIAIIPDSWFKDFSFLFNFLEPENGSSPDLRLKKHHLALIQDLEKNSRAEIHFSSKLHKLNKSELIENQALPGDFSGKLRPYQLAGFNWLSFLNQYEFGGCLADDMGLGKTVQTLALLQAQKDQGLSQASLLVMPTSLIYNWEMEALRFTPELRLLVYTGTDRIKKTDHFSDYDLVLTSYGITRLDIDILEDYFFNYIILDESQVIKNPESIVSKSVKRLKSKQRLILTGTPLENSTIDLWSQMNFLNPGLLGTKSFFKKEFQYPIETKNDPETIKKLSSIVKPFILRRKKDQVATELPPKVENAQFCPMTTRQEEEYEKVKSHYRNLILENLEKPKKEKNQFLLLQGLTRLRLIANHPVLESPEYDGDSGKFQEVINRIQLVLSEDHKIIIFSQFVKHLSLVKNYLITQGIPFAYLDGTTRNRKEQVASFQNQKSKRIFLISLKAGGLGLNLTEADYVFILDPWWNPAVEAQAIDRAHRIGQGNRVFIYKFISRNTVEEKILHLQKSKLKLAQNLIQVDENILKRISWEDINLLLT